MRCSPPSEGGEGPYEGCQVRRRSFSFHAIASVARSAAKRSVVARDSGKTTVPDCAPAWPLAPIQFMLKVSFPLRALGPLGQSCSHNRAPQGRLPFECCPGDGPGTSSYPSRACARPTCFSQQEAAGVGRPIWGTTDLPPCPLTSSPTPCDQDCFHSTDDQNCAWY